MVLSYFSFAFLLFNIANIADSSCSTTGNFIIDSTIGKLEGSCHMKNFNTEKKKLIIWTGVPYAEPPIGNKRFKEAVPKTPFSEVLETKKVANSCMQLVNMQISSNLEFSKPYELAKNSTSNISEDCLYLNIYVPKSDDDDNDDSKKKAIMFIIHGGDGTTGSGSLDIHEPSVFATLTNTIVVTINYRLGIFGFLKINENDGIKGNLGFLDQHLALKWVNENAEKFGGDKSKITLMGYGSGANFVGLHLIYKPGFALFRNVIMQSGSVVNLASNLLSKTAAIKRANEFIDTYYKCGSSNKLDCIMKVDARNLTLSSRLFLVNHMSKKSLLTSLKIETLFEPFVDGDIFRESPVRAFRIGNFKHTKIITGFPAQAGASKIPLNYGLVTDKNQLKKIKPHNGIIMRQQCNFESFMIFLKKYYAFYPMYSTQNNMKSVHTAIIKSYTGFNMESYRKNSKQQKSNYFFDLRTLLTDENYACPTMKLLSYISDKCDVYVYVYNHRIGTSKYPIWYGVTESDELASVFGQSYRKNDNNNVSRNPWLETDKIHYTIDDKSISLNVMKLWANFVHNNNPNKNSQKTWPIFKKKDTKHKNLYLGFNQKDVKIKQFGNLKHCKTWDHDVPSAARG